MSYLDRLEAPGSKKLLAVDGGGIRGVLTLEVLARLEAMLAEEQGAGESFVLADYLNYIGGTSTGAGVAAGLAMGRRVSELLDLYNGGLTMYSKPALYNNPAFQLLLMATLDVYRLGWRATESDLLVARDDGCHGLAAP